MKNIITYINEQRYNGLVIENLCEIFAEDMVNESFKSSLLTNLAKEIYKAEATNNKREIENNERMKKEYPTYSSKPKLTNFSSFFGPVSAHGDKVRCIKWNEITDDQFVLYKAIDEGFDKKLEKLLKQVYTQKIKADFIVCEKDTKNIKFFIRGYNANNKNNVEIFFLRYDKQKIYKYADGSETSYTQPGSVERMTKPKYKYEIRPLKLQELMEEIQGYDVYALEITDDMINDYKTLTIDRKNAQKGVINYDKDSLDKLWKEQQARYRTLVKELKANKIPNDDEFLEEINKVNKEVQDLYKQIVNTATNIESYYDLGRLMEYVSNSYYNFFEYKKSLIRGNDLKQRYEKEKGKPYSGTTYDEEYAKEYIVRSKEKLDDVKKYIEKIKSNIN